MGLGPKRTQSAFTFPDGFLWGAATSSHQVEGGNTNNDWYEWERLGRTAVPSGMAADHYSRYTEDLDIAKKLGHNAFRLSVEWSRIEPQPGSFAQEEINHYREVLLAARARGLKTFVTLHHFTNPLWVANLGGWSNPEIINWFARFTDTTVTAMGDLVDYWMTVNEPNVNALTSYGVGVTPPGVRNLQMVPAVLANFLKAHAAAYHAIHRQYPDAKVGFAHHMRVFHPARRWHPGDRLIASYIHRFWNLQFVEALHTGHIHFSIPFLVTHKEEAPEIKGTLDFIGVNYYSRDFIKMDLSLPQRFIIVPPGQNAERTDLGWEIYPRGIYDSLKSMAPYHLPQFITENGIADAVDAKRTKFICTHLNEVARAMRNGVDVQGYLYWSLIDNFEWLEGYTPRFGLVEIDYHTQSRTIRPSAMVLSEIIATKKLDPCQ